MGNWLKRFVSVALVLLMVLLYMPIGIFAAEINDEQILCVTTEAELQNAIAIAKTGDTIQLLNDIVLSDSVTIAADKTLTLDLNSCKLSQEKACVASYEMVSNNGHLTITGNGTLSFTDTGAGATGTEWASYTIRNSGNLIVENGTIEHLGTQNGNMNNAIFQYSGSTTIYDGTFSAPYSRSLRLWHGDVTIHGGIFDGQVWVQPFANDAQLTITGGSFQPSSRGNDGSSVYLTNGTYHIDFTVTGGKFATKIGCANTNKLAGAITGGIFTQTAKENTGSVLKAENYIWLEYATGNFAVVAPDPAIVVPDNVVDTLVNQIVTQTPNQEVTNDTQQKIEEAVLNAIEEIISNTTVADSAYDPIEEIENVAQLQVTLNNVDVKLEENDGLQIVTITEVTYQVSPLDEEGIKITNPEKPITFRLPVPSSISGEHLDVYHEGKLMGIYVIHGDGSNRFVEITSDTFSEYTLKQTASVVKIDSIGYITLEEALAAANEGDVIMLLEDITLDSELFIDIQVTLDINGHNLDGHIYHGTVYEPDCVNDGYTEYICIDCGMAFADDETAALGHADDDCDRVCDRCDTSLRTAQTDLEDSLQDLSSSMESAFQVTMRLLQVLLQLPKTIFSAFNGLLR